MEFSFEDIKFVDKKEAVRAVFLTYYYFDIPKSELREIGDFHVKDKNLVFTTGKNVEKKFSRLLSNGFFNLFNKLTGRKTVYIHSNSSIPLMGTSYFGIVDRDTNLIELRPNTGCNLNCIYCSLNEGGEKAVDFVIEKDYLFQEVKKLVEFKDATVEIHINPQGEPLLYTPLVELVRDVASITGVEKVSMDTNATLLNKKKADELMEAGLTRFNISLDSLNKASEIAGCIYPVKQVKQVIEYIATKGNVIIAPLLIPGINDEEMEELIKFAKGNNISLGIQNFLNYKHGRNPVKAMPMENFYQKLRELENKHNIKLIYTASDFGVYKTKKLPRPLKKEDVVDCEVVSPGRGKNEAIGVARNRCIEIKDIKKYKNQMKAKINSTKHNIFRASQR